MDPVAAAIISFAYASVVWYMLLYWHGRMHSGLEEVWQQEIDELMLVIKALEAEKEPVWYIASEGTELTVERGPYPPD